MTETTAFFAAAFVGGMFIVVGTVSPCVNHHDGCLLQLLSCPLAVQLLFGITPSQPCSQDFLLWFRRGPGNGVKIKLIFVCRCIHFFFGLVNYCMPVC